MVSTIEYLNSFFVPTEISNRGPLALNAISYGDLDRTTTEDRLSKGGIKERINSFPLSQFTIGHPSDNINPSDQKPQPEGLSIQ